MSQLLLDIAPEKRQRLENFIVGRNAELIAALRHALSGGWERSFYLWGDQGSGKTHLLRACVQAGLDVGHTAIYMRGSVPASAMIVAVDDVEQLDDSMQIALFNLYNRIREAGGVLLTSGQKSLAYMRLRDDLRSRLAWGLVYQVHGLTDEEKAIAMLQHAQEKGYTLTAEVTQYLLRRGRRDLPSLLSVLDALDQYSLRLHRVPSVPLLKEVLKQEQL